MEMLRTFSSNDAQFKRRIPMPDLNDPTLLQDQDFQAVLNSFLTAYKPILEHELSVAESAATLIKESKAHPPTCDEEIALAVKLFERFYTKMLPFKCFQRRAVQLWGRPDNG